LKYKDLTSSMPFSVGGQNIVWEIRHVQLSIVYTARKRDLKNASNDEYVAKRAESES
jgi:hypothetical protein